MKRRAGGGSVTSNSRHNLNFRNTNINNEGRKPGLDGFGSPKSSSSSLEGGKGTRPTASPTSIREILLMVVMYLCKKSIFFDTNIKVAIYLGGLFLISLIGDFLPFPKTYLARSDNFLNVFFVKIGWGWTLILTLPFVILISYTLCCGNIYKTLSRNVTRILIATCFWFIWTKSFNYIESRYGRCLVKGYYTKSSCLKAGHLWSGFDISGHAFILIHSSLVMIEEARPIIKWDTIKEHLRNELYNRSVGEYSSTNPLRNLSTNQIRNLRFLYDCLTPFIRIIFIAMAALQLLWDIMLVGTMLYYHRMVEKFISGVVAIFTWYFTYRFWYPSSMLPDLPGSGSFYYQHDFSMNMNNKRFCTSTMSSGLGSGSFPGTSNNPSNENNNLGNSFSNTNANSVPSFMGMPLYIDLKYKTSTGTPSSSSAGSSVHSNPSGKLNT